jgi:hypothetical protein
MITHRFHMHLRRACALILLAAALPGCGGSAPEPVTQPATSEPASNGPSAKDAGATEAQPAGTSGEPAPAAPASPPPSEPSASSPVVLAQEPALESMASARAPAKLGVPVDLRYRFDAAPLTNQPVILHVAAVPRVAGSNLTVSVKPVKGVQIAAGGALNVQKANVNGAYRQQFSVTRGTAAPKELRVLVTMDLPEGSAFGFFSVPLEPENVPAEQDLVKQR